MNILICLKLDTDKAAQGGLNQGVVLLTWCFYENDAIGFIKHLKSRHLR